MENKARVLLAIPNMNSIHPLLVMRLLNWHTQPTKGVEQIGAFMPTNQIPHDSARNQCINHFLAGTDFTHLFFVDSDVIPPLDAIEKLIAADKDVVTGMYKSFKKDPDIEEPVARYNAFVYGNDRNGDYGLLTVDAGEGLVPIKRAGAGCLMIKRHVLETMKEKNIMPWFKFQYHTSGVMYYGEDIDFCAKAEQAGFEIFADFDVVCRHLKEILI